MLLKAILGLSTKIIPFKCNFLYIVHLAKVSILRLLEILKRLKVMNCKLSETAVHLIQLGTH